MLLSTSLLTFVECFDRIYAWKDRGESRQIGRSLDIRGTSAMSETAPAEINAAIGRRFQFSLWTMLVLVTGLSLLCSLVAWRATLGSLIAIPVVSIWWTIAALRAGRPRLAYYLVTPAMGAIVFLLLSTPIAPVSMGIVTNLSWREIDQHAWPFIWSMCLATLATAAIVRRRIRVRFANRLAVIGVGSVYLAAFIFPLFFLPILLTFGRAIAGIVLPAAGEQPWHVIAVGAAAVSPVVATTSLHVAAPAGVAFCYILRYIDPPENDLNETERLLVRIVDELQSEGHNKITHTDIFARAEADEKTLSPHLGHLRRLGILKWDGDTGFGHRRRSSA